MSSSSSTVAKPQSHDHNINCDTELSHITATKPKTKRTDTCVTEHSEDDYDTFPHSKEHSHHSNDNDNDIEQQQQQHFPITRSTYIYAMCAALNSVNLGFDLGVSTNAGPLIQTDFGLTDFQLELFLGSLNFWSILGALISPLVTDRYGRRMTFIMAAIGFIVGVCIMSTATSYETLMIGRFFVGIGVGVGEAIDPMYIAEIAPKHVRGELVSWAEAGVAFGVVLGFSSSFVFWSQLEAGQVHIWRHMLALGGIMPCVMIYLVTYVMPESPRWLVAQNRELQARTILQRTYPNGYNIDHIIDEITSSLALEDAAAHAVGWKAILCEPSPSVRRMLLVGVGIAIIQQAVGIDSIMFYLMFVIQRSGIKSEMGQVAALVVLGFVKLMFVFVGAKLFDTLGRRPLLFTSLLGMAASLVVVSFTFVEEESPVSQIVTVLALAAYLAFFSTGLGPGNWVIVSEIFATSIRAKAMSVAILPNRITATIMASTFLSTAHALGWPGFFLLLAGICVLSCVFLFIYLPETKGKSLEEMSHYFAEITGDRSILDVEEQLAKKVSCQMASDDSEDEHSTSEEPEGVMA